MLKTKHEQEIITDDPELWWKLKQQHQSSHHDVEAEGKHPEHGVEDKEAETKKPPSFWRHFKIQLYIAATIFVAFVFLKELDEPKSNQVVAWLKGQLNNQIPFVELSQWYTETFSGSPSFIPTFDNKSQQVMSKEAGHVLPLPVPDGLVIRSFADSLTGIELSTDKGAHVFAVDEGRVVFVREEGDTVIIQHSNQYVTIYAKLASTKVELNQWVKAGEKIGGMSVVEQKPLLFYAIKKENQYIDPLGVVSFD